MDSNTKREYIIKQKKALEHCISAYYFNETAFHHLPDPEKINYYKNIIENARDEIDSKFNEDIINTYVSFILYAANEKIFKEMLSKEQLEKFNELRKGIILWYELQKEVLKFDSFINKTV